MKDPQHLNNLLTASIHISWLIASISLGVLLGIALASFVEIPLTQMQLIFIAITLFVVVIIKRIKVVIILAVIAGMFLGLARGSAVANNLHAYEPYYGKDVILQGKVAEDVSFGPDGDTRIRLVNVKIDNQQLSGVVWVSTMADADLRRSDMVAFAGVLQKGFGNLPASMFYARLTHAERPIHGDVAREVRDWFSNAVRKVVPEPEVSLGIGFLTGQHSALPQDLDNQLRLLGLTHIVVASGYNLTILVRFARQALMRISKYTAFIGASGMMASFIMITGASPSMSRAGLIAGLSLVAWYFGRTIHPFVLLPFSAAVTALINPSFVWGDIGWYLSFAAFAGVMILAPLLRHYFWGETEPHTLLRVVIETLSAQILTLPIIALIFGEYSPLALFANVLILPLVPLAMVLTFITGIAQLLFPLLSPIAGWPTTAVLEYMTAVTGWLAQLPWASGSLKFGWLAVLASYAALLLIIVWLKRVTNHSFKKDNIVV